MHENTSITISEAEWEIMRVVWANVSVTSREVIDLLEDKMDWKESTIKTLIGRLVDKGALNTTKEGRHFIYHASISEEDTLKSYSEDILEHLCHKKNSLVIEHLIKDANLSKSDIRSLVLLLEMRAIDAPEVVSCSCTPGQCNHQLVS